MCSTAASIEDKKNLHKNETSLERLDHYNNHHMHQFILLALEHSVRLNLWPIFRRTYSFHRVLIWIFQSRNFTVEVFVTNCGFELARPTEENVPQNKNGYV